MSLIPHCSFLLVKYSSKAVIDFEKYLFTSLFNGIMITMDSKLLKNYYADMEPNPVIKPCMIELVVHHNSDGPDSSRSSFGSWQGEDDF